MGSAQNFLSFLIPFVVFFISLPSLMAELSLSVRFSLKLRKAHGIIPDAATPVSLDPFLDSFLLHVGTLPRHFVLTPTGRASGCKRGSSSGQSSTSCRSSRSWLSPSSSYLLVSRFFWTRHRYVCRGFRRGSSQTLSTRSPSMLTRGSV